MSETTSNPAPHDGEEKQQKKKCDRAVQTSVEPPGGASPGCDPLGSWGPGFIDGEGI